MGNSMAQYGFKVLMTILLGIIAYVWQGNATKLAELEKSVVQLRFDIIEMRASMLSKQDVQEIVNAELLKRGLP
ncbi:MAG: hypothetical protein J5746_12105 [Victivallales bacterium]|nr:hypothetical protein [Victivallales bacterium]